MKKEFESYIKHHQEVIGKTLEGCLDTLESFARTVVETLRKGNTIIVFGNGGSAADAQHFVCELVGSFLHKKNRRGLPAIALTTNTSSLTSISNDFSFSAVFKRQIEALARPGDLCVGISTSGHSRNVYEALSLAREMGCRTAALLGGDGGEIKDVADIPLIVPDDLTPVIQEAHVMMIHMVCKIVDDAFATGIIAEKRDERNHKGR